MAGPQSFTPHPVSDTKPRRRFTLQQANATLPLVKRIVGDIVRCHQQITKHQEALEKTASAKDAKKEAKKDSKEQAVIQANLQSGLEHLQDYVDELAGVGAELKDYRVGLIDFTGRHQGHDVCLCWKLGEETIGHWHEADAGFAGRQPVATLDEK